jgi:hypothetical protein
MADSLIRFPKRRALHAAVVKLTHQRGFYGKRKARGHCDACRPPSLASTGPIVALETRTSMRRSPGVMSAPAEQGVRAPKRVRFDRANAIRSLRRRWRAPSVAGRGRAPSLS